MKTIKNFLIVLCIISLNTTFSQTYFDTICWVKVDSAYLPSEDSTNTDFTKDSTLNAILVSNGVNFYELAFPFSKKEVLRKIIEIRCDSCDIDSLYSELSTTFNTTVAPSNSFYEFEKFTANNTGTPCYVPADLG